MSGIGFFIVPKDEDIFAMDPQDLADSLYALADSPVCGLPTGDYDVIPIGAPKTVSTFDTDALAYITAVEAADGEALEDGVREAIDAFVKGCKADAIWDAIKASCILAGARTLNGCLVPLVGAAPTNFNFVSADYDRKTGLKGDEATKYLNSNRPFNADAVNNVHISAYTTTAPTSPGRYVGARGNREILGNILEDGFRTRFGSNTLYTLATGLDSTPCLIGCSRSSSAGFSWRSYGAGGTQTDTISAATGFPYHIFAQSASDGDGAISMTAARLSFYSIGEAIDLTALDARVTTLMTALDGAIA